MVSKVNIGKAIETGLKKKGWSRKKLAEIVGVTPPAVTMWIKNERIPSGDILIEIAMVLEIVTDLFPAEEQKRAANIDIQLELSRMKQKIAELEQKLSPRHDPPG